MKAVVSWSVHFLQRLQTECGVYGGELETALHLKNWSLLYSTEGLAITKATTNLRRVYNQKWR